ncbi:MAG: cell wall hydrolase [Pseudomonadota bacterium]
MTALSLVVWRAVGREFSRFSIQKSVLIPAVIAVFGLGLNTPSAWSDETSIEPVFKFDRAKYGHQLGCLAMNIYHEGRGESAEGRAAIASVTMNRVRSKHFPNSVCEVVWQRKQFSWTEVAPRHHVVKDQKAWRQALVMAKLFIDGARESAVGSATHYHALHVAPNWLDTSKLVAFVGGHAFYTL